MTIRDLAAKVGLAPGNIGLLEADKTKPKMATLKQLTTALNVSFAYLGCFESLPTKTFGQCIAKARHYHGLTKKELAAALGVNIKTLREWEEDKRKPLQRYIDQLKVFITILKD